MSKEISFEEQTPVKGWDISSLERYIRLVNNKITYLVENTHTHPWPLDEALDYEQLQHNLREANKELKKLQNIIELADPSESNITPIIFAEIPTTPNPNSNNDNNNLSVANNRNSESRLERKRQVEEKRRLILEKQCLSEKEEEKRLLQQLEEMRSQRMRADAEREQKYLQEIVQYKQREEKLLHELKKMQLQMNALQFVSKNDYEEYLEQSPRGAQHKSYLRELTPDRNDDNNNNNSNNNNNYNRGKMAPTENITKLQDELAKKNFNLLSLQPPPNVNPAPAVKTIPQRMRSDSTVNNDAIEEIKDWEKKKQRFVMEMEDIVKQTELKLEYICTDYLVNYESQIFNLCDDRKLRFEFRKFIEQEKQRVNSQLDNLFSCEKYHSSISSIVNHISVIQQGLSGVDNTLIKAQAIARGFITRKKWKPVFKSMKQRARCALEIYETEKAYNQKLISLIKLFRTRMEKELPPAPTTNLNLNLNFQVLDKISFLSSVTKKDIDTIFSTIPLIINTSDQLLKSLENRMKNWSNSQSLGDVFLEFAPYFKSYIQYVNNYDNAMAILERGMKIPSFVSLLKKCKSDAESGGLDIGSFLIMPIQRVPRYALLLKELHRFTPPFHRDYEQLSSALIEISKVAQLINENKREEENKRKVRSIAELFGNKCENLVQPQRRFVHQGEVIVNSHNFCTLEKEFREEPYECYLFLFNDLLLIGKKPKTSLASTLKLRVGAESVYNYKEQIYVDGMVVGEWNDEEVALPAFFIKYKNRLPDHFYTQSIADRDEWLSVLKQTIQNSESRRSTLRLSQSFDPWELKIAEEGANTTAIGTATHQLSTGNIIHSNTIRKQEFRPVEYSTIRELLPLYGEAMWLLKELFTVPIELQTFIPEYCQKFPPGYLAEINNRLQLIKRRLNDLNIVRDKIIPLIKNEKMVVELNDAMLYGKVPLHSAFIWIQQNYPPDSVDTKPRELLKDLLQWYNHVTKLWNKVMEIPLDN